MSSWSIKKWYIIPFKKEESWSLLMYPLMKELII